MRLAVFGLVIAGIASYSGTVAVVLAQATSGVLTQSLGQVTAVLTQVDASLAR